MRIPRYKPSPLAVCFLAALLVLIVARDLATRHQPWPIVTGLSLGLFVALHQVLIPFTRTTADQNGTHRG